MSAHGAGKAYAIGLMMGLMAKGLTYDEAKWITVHPNGAKNKGSHALIDSETGQILGGMGGKHTGKTIKQIKTQTKAKSGKTNQAGGSKTGTKITASTPLPESHKSWNGRDKDGYPVVGPEAAQYYKDNAYDGRSSTGKRAREDFSKHSINSSFVNAELRADPSLADAPENVKARVERMDAYFNDPKHKTKQPMKLLRGVADVGAAEQMIKSGRFKEDGYVSTTTDLETVKSFSKAGGSNRYIFALNVPKGYGATSMTPFNYSREKEILLQRNVGGDIKHTEKKPNERGGFDYIAYVDMDPAK